MEGIRTDRPIDQKTDMRSCTSKKGLQLICVLVEFSINAIFSFVNRFDCGSLTDIFHHFLPFINLILLYVSPPFSKVRIAISSVLLGHGSGVHKNKNGGGQCSHSMYVCIMYIYIILIAKAISKLDRFFKVNYFPIFFICIFIANIHTDV